MLTGPELLSKVRQLNGTAKSKSDYIRATGYIVHREGRNACLLRTAFYEALLQASGVTFGRRSTTWQKLPQLSFRTVVLPNGSLIVGKEYLSRIGLKPGDRVQVRPVDNSICLSAESSTRMERSPSQLAPASEGEQVEVWFATNRRRISNGYGRRRSVGTSYGKVLVHVPVAHRFGETGSNPLQRILRLERRDDTLRLTGIEDLSAECFFEQLRATISSNKEQAESTHALVFLHGYNVTFRDAAIRAAQLHVDLNVNGATAFFSWPSKGRLTSYLADGSTIGHLEK
jgi:hypothetical protein